MRGDNIPYIYKIVNDINDKVYIGATHYNLGKRWKEHLQDARKTRCNERPLYHAINMYGEEHFRICLIEECTSNILYEREKYWINEYNSFANGYNATYGGVGKPNVDYKRVISEYAKTQRVDITAKKLGIDQQTVRTILRENGIRILSSGEVIRRENERKVSMYSLDGVKLLDFNSSFEAATFVSQLHGMKSFQSAMRHIIEVCRGKRKTAYKYKWCFT